MTDTPPPGFTTYHAYLRVLRETNNISYSELAEELDVSPDTIPECEAGSMPLDFVLRALAGVEGVLRRRRVAAHEQRERLVALAEGLRPGDEATVHAISHDRAAAFRELVAQLSNPALPDDRFNLAVQVASAIITGTPITVRPPEEKPVAGRRYHGEWWSKDKQCWAAQAWAMGPTYEDVVAAIMREVAQRSPHQSRVHDPANWRVVETATDVVMPVGEFVFVPDVDTTATKTAITSRKYFVQYFYKGRGWYDNFTGSSNDANGFESLVDAEAARKHELLRCARVGIEAADNAKDPASYRIVLRTDEVVA